MFNNPNDCNTNTDYDTFGKYHDIRRYHETATQLMRKKIFSEADHLRIAMATARWQVIAGAFSALGGAFFSFGLSMFLFFLDKLTFNTNIEWVAYIPPFTLMGLGLLMIGMAFYLPNKKIEEFMTNLDILENWKDSDKSKTQSG